jgi:hypothetical protein
MELAALVVLAVGAALADGGEVLRRLGDDLVEELKVDAASLFWRTVSSFSSQSDVRRRGARNIPFTAPVLVTFPLLSTSTTGPVQATSKKTFVRGMGADEA